MEKLFHVKLLIPTKLRHATVSLNSSNKQLRVSQKKPPLVIKKGRRDFSVNLKIIYKKFRESNDGKPQIFFSPQPVGNLYESIANTITAMKSRFCRKYKTRNSPFI